MNKLVNTKKRKLKEFEPIDFKKKDNKKLSITDAMVKNEKSIQIDKNTFSEYDKSTEFSALKNIVFNAESFVSGSDKDDIKQNYRNQVPFELAKSTIGVDFEKTKSGMQIINNHLDDEGMQSPWVFENVGGSQHRRNKFNSKTTRIEAYHISENDLGLLISKPNNSPNNYRRSAGSPCYNFQNIKSFNPIGNYNFDYEIVLTSGRLSNNKHLIVSGTSFINQKPASSNYISGFFDFENIERKKNSHVIVNRFSSPGGPETSAGFGLDRESGEYSVYNSINYRNRNVREVLDAVYSTPSDKFGKKSGSPLSGDFHKTPRNTRRFIGSSGNEKKDDSFLVNYSIPSNDFGYLWVSRSSEDGIYDFLRKNSNFPYQHAGSNYNNIDSSQTIGFLSESLSGNNVTFSRLNNITRYKVSENENLITYTSGNLNQHLLNAYGPYGFSTWKQIRNKDNPIARSQRKNNEISIVVKSGTPNVFSSPGTFFNYSNTQENDVPISEPRKIVSFKEPPVSNRFYPLKASLHFYEELETQGIILTSEVPKLIPQQTLKNIWDEKIPFHSMLIQKTADNIVSDATTVVMKASVQSDISRFANEELSIKLNDKEPNFFQNENLQKINLFFQETQALSSEVVRQLTYTETIYPKERSAFTDNSINRPYYKFFGWNDKRKSRRLILSGNLKYSNFLTNNEEQKIFATSSFIDKEVDFSKSFFNSYDRVDLNATGSKANILSSSFITSSTWVLDSRENFASKPLNITSSYFTDPVDFLENRDQGTRGEGILQNDFSIFALGYNGLRGAAPFAPVYNRRIPQTYNSDVYLSGESLWEATGSDPFGPFYQKYSNFAKNLKYFSRGYSLVPEFTMSSIVENIYAADNIEKASTPENFLQLTGTVFSTSEDSSNNISFFKNFSNSEFMKFFKPLVKNIEQANLDLKPGRLTLRCQANLKLLPYRGFYPAERAVQISEIFDRNYLSERSYLSKYIPNDAISEDQANKYLKLRIQNAKSQASKPLFSPGVLFNSIKSGVAVDYPIFSSSIEPAIDYIIENNVTSSIISFQDLGLNSLTCFTGSEINSTIDSGIPRIKGSTSRRISIDDLINPERLVDEIIYDNEPHPSASLIYGSAEHVRVLNRPTIFGNLDTIEVKEKNAIDFSITKESFTNAMRSYKSAINNFTAETVNFFLRDQKLQTHISDAVSPYLKSGVNYKMRVYINNQDTLMYDRHSAFGPPVDDGDIPRTTYLASSSFVGGSFATGQINFSGLTRTSVNSSLLRLFDYDGISKDYIFVNGATIAAAAAQAEITFDLSGTGFDGSELTIQNATDKSGITYLFTANTSIGKSTGATFNGKVIVFLTSSMNAAAVASEFASALASSNGHGGTILASHNSSSGKTTLTQATTGTSGNIEVIGSGKFDKFSERVSGFSGGVNSVTISNGGKNSSGQIVVQVGTSTTESSLAIQLSDAINSFNGHAGTIVTSPVSSVLKLAQHTRGTLGNRLISGTGAMAGSVIAGFDGGSNPAGISFLTQSVVTQSGSHGFLPYIPSFLDAGARPYAEISFTPGESNNYTIPTIIENSSVEYYNISAPVTAQTTTNYLNAMSLSASVDLKKYISLYSDNFNLDEEGNRSAKKESKKYRWIIQPRWETPIMDFTDAKVSALNLSTNEVNHVTGSPWKERNVSNYYELLNKTQIPYLTASTGMWHQSGTIIKNEDLKGYYITIESGEDNIDNNKGDLASELGFVNKGSKTNVNSNAKPINSKKMGVLAKEKNISESIVAIPYYTNESDKINLFDLNSNELAKARAYNSKIKNSFFYNLQKAQIKDELLEIEKDYDDWFDSVGHDSVSSISYQLRMMEKYVLPPHFDFIKNEKVNPHVIYFFQFKSTLTESDLARIWQNLYPRSSEGPGNLKVSEIQKTQRESDVQYITGFLDTSILPDDLEVKSNYENYELFLNNNVRWLVFKVKYRSMNQLSNIRNDSIPKFKQDLESVNGVLIKQPLATSVTEQEDESLFSKFSYNWPYDYFSLVENIKVDTKVDFFSSLISANITDEVEQPLTSRVETRDIEADEQEAETQIIVAQETTTSSEPLSNLVIRQEIKNDNDSAPSPANVFNIPVTSGYSLKINSESIYVNGVLQVSGASMDYTISGNIITFTYSIQDGDSIYATYIRE